MDGCKKETSNMKVSLDLTGKRNFGLKECIALAQDALAADDDDNDTQQQNPKNNEHGAPMVTELVMDRIGIGHEGGCVLAGSLSSNKTLLRLDLERNGLGNIGGRAIANSLLSNKTLRRLNLSLNDLKASSTKTTTAAAAAAATASASEAIGDALAANESLTELVLVKCGLGPNGGKAVARGLARNRTLQSLNITGNDVMAEGGQAIGEAMKKNRALQSIHLRWNRIGCGGNKGVQSIAEALAQQQQDDNNDGDSKSCNAANSSSSCSAAALRFMDIGINDLYCGGAVLIGNNLAKNHTLIEINLERNEIGSNGAIAIARALQRNKALKRLVLSGNPNIGNAGAVAIGRHGLSHNTTLRDLHLVGCGIGIDGARAIGRALCSSSTEKNMNGGTTTTMSSSSSSLFVLRMDKNKIGPIGGMAVAEGLKNNASLRELYLSRNNIGTRGGKAFAIALRTNRSLRVLDLENNDIEIAGGNDDDDDDDEEEDNNEKKDESNNDSDDMNNNNEGEEDSVAAAHIVESIVDHPSLRIVNLSDNGIAMVPIECQLKLARRIAEGEGATSKTEEEETKEERDEEEESEEKGIGDGKKNTIEIDLSHNPLSSPPLGRRADPDGLREYLALLLAESTTAKFIRLMVLGFGGVGKSTFCDAITLQSDADRARFHSSLVPLDRWDTPMIAAWARRLGTPFASSAASVLENNNITGRQLKDLVVVTKNQKRKRKNTATSIITDSDDDEMEEEICDEFSNSGSSSSGETHYTYHLSQMLEDLIEKEERNNNATKNNTANATSTAMMNASEKQSLARAIASLLRKGYFSTVGATKVDGLLTLGGEQEEIDDGDDEEEGEKKGCRIINNNGGSSTNKKRKTTTTTRRNCSLVDFAGQMEYLVSHQLLLSSLHTICMVIQPAASFGCPQNRHCGSWYYWSRFLRALGDRRTGSLLLAVSQLDKVNHHHGKKDDNGDRSSSSPDNHSNNDALVANELEKIRNEIPSIGSVQPIRLDYRPDAIRRSTASARRAISRAAGIVAKDWWIPASYEKLSRLVRNIGEKKKSRRELPILAREELRNELSLLVNNDDDDEGLQRMHGDAQLLKRGIEYLEAVGDVMSDDRLDCLLLDPIGWFASFLAHFIRDDDVVTSVQLDRSASIARGVVYLKDIVSALRHDYANRPDEQVPRVMSLVCGLELCIPLPATTEEEEKTATSFLFPCLLPVASVHEVVRVWPYPPPATTATTTATANNIDSSLPNLVFRGHRFRAKGGFLPPGLFPGLLARCRHFSKGVVCWSSRTWKNCAVLVFGLARVMIRIIESSGGDDELSSRPPSPSLSSSAIVDVVAAAPTTEDLFVGAAKGQASVVIWTVHLIKMFLRNSYPRLRFDEFFMCPSPECHRCYHNNRHDNNNNNNNGGSIKKPCYYNYHGTEFPVVAKKKPKNIDRHSCEADGCWRQLGPGHKLESMVLRRNNVICNHCKKEPRFALRGSLF